MTLAELKIIKENHVFEAFSKLDDVEQAILYRLLHTCGCRMEGIDWKIDSMLRKECVRDS